MQSWKDFFVGKRITQMGLGLLGRGVSDAQFLARYAEHVHVTDMKSAEQLSESLEKIKECSNISLRLGEHVLEDFQDVDFIMKGAGIPFDSPYVAHARSHNIPLYMDESLFFSLMPQCLFVGITGSLGKTTTTMLIHHIAHHAYAKKGKQVILAGNIWWKATLPLLEEVNDGDIVIAELSSWQLQGFGDISRSPHISVFTNFVPDHLNYYKGDMQRYFDDKAHIFSHQTNKDTLILTQQSHDVIKDRFDGEIKSSVVVAQTNEYDVFIQASPLVGDHNKYNIACAVACARAMGISDEECLEAIKTYTGAPGRLETISTVANVTVINDTAGTTPETIGVGLRACSKGKNVILIAGGADKTLDLEPMFSPIRDYAKAVLVLPGSGSDKMVKEFDARDIAYTRCQSIEEAVINARRIAQEGDVVLLCPGFASFGEFVNQFDRGEQFKSLVKTHFG